MTSEYFGIQFFIALLLIAAAVVLFIFFPYLDAIVLGITLTILFHPVYKFIRKLMPRWESLASFITVIISIIVILVPLIFFGLRIFEEAQGLYIQFAVGNKSQVVDFLQFGASRIAPWLNIDFSQYTKQILSVIVDNIGPVFSRIASVTATFLFAFFTLYYLLKDGDKLRDKIIMTIPLPHEDADKIISKLSRMASSVIRGSLIIAVLQGFFVGLAFFFFGLPNPILWGSISIMAALVPFIGVALVILPAALSMILSGNLLGSLGFMIFGFLAVMLLINFLQPKLINRDAEAHPLLILFSVLGGITVFGPVGFLLGPLALSLFLTLIEMHPTRLGY